MALQGLPLAFLLALAPLLLAQGEKVSDPKSQGGAQEAETCQRPVSWDPRIQMAPVRENYKKNEEVTLSCNSGFQPSFTYVICAGPAQLLNYSGYLNRDVWLGRNSSNAWIPIEENVVCIETCQRPHWGQGLWLAPDQKNYKNNEEVMLSCPEGFQPSFSHVKCAGKVLSIINGKPVHREAWIGRDSRRGWINIEPSFSVECIEKCQKPQGNPRFIFDEERGTFNLSEVVNVRCPEGHWPPFMEIKCVKLNPRKSSTIPRSGWIVRHGEGRWGIMEENLTCVEILQVVSETLEISSTGIKLNWTCRVPDVCKNIRARCRLEEPSSPPCEAEELKGEEILHGQEGMFACPPLQPFTVYSVIISLPPSTILYTQLLRTKETLPDKVEKLRLDARTGSLQWKALPSCKGEIIGYQVNITARRAHDGSFLEFEQVLVNQSVTQYTLSRQTPGSKYRVTVQGITAAGAGPASLLEFQSYVAVAGQPLGPWPGTAVTVVVVLSVLILLSAGILWFVLSRKKKALPSKAEEEHYTELQPYENADDYCVIKDTVLAERDAGKGVQRGELKTLPVLKSSRKNQSIKGEDDVAV
ncbi:uncharacterized protein LOC104056586 [Cuculus canorus]|uniref:uncharacterized protein LOC104056586 n=1 Tax=Cuculus canorus TaxID=55661 RepID=UPI0023AAC808|nr:uncharacterized protein LOC104056586 [Cuculus canorus]